MINLCYLTDILLIGKKGSVVSVINKLIYHHSNSHGNQLNRNNSITPKKVAGRKY